MFVSYFLSKNTAVCTGTPCDQHIFAYCVYYNFRFVNTYSRIWYIFLFQLIIPIKAVSLLFETHIKQVYKLLFLAKFSLKCRIYLLKLVTSVDVDVGECTDAIQHKDGDFDDTI